MSVSRRTLITVAAIVVAVALIVIFVITGVTRKGGTSTADPTPQATYSSAPTVRPSATPGSGKATGSPSASPAPGTQVVPGATPSATAAPGTASGKAQKPVAFDAKAEITSQVHVTLSPLKAVTGKADGVGEVSGPSLQFTVTIQNGSTKLLNLSSTVVNVTYGSARTPSSEFTSSRKPFPATVKAGASAQATFIYAVPTKERSNVRITVDYGVTVPTVVFAGQAPA